MVQEGVNLIVERSNVCYGPGDPITVKATVKSVGLHTVILRGFEFYLKEATVYRAGIHAQGKKSAPQVRQMNISESKVAVNATLCGGTSHTSDLTCVISADHTTTTLNAARHIDVTYTLHQDAHGYWNSSGHGFTSHYIELAKVFLLRFSNLFNY